MLQARAARSLTGSGHSQLFAKNIYSFSSRPLAPRLSFNFSTLHQVQPNELIHQNGDFIKLNRLQTDVAADIVQPLKGITLDENVLNDKKIIEEKKSNLDKAKELNFDDPESSHGSKTIAELIRSLIVLRLCQIKPLVNNADKLLSLSYRTLGSTLTDEIVRNTFFQHFCGGEDAEKIRPVIQSLKSNGIGSILDYAAESDIESSSDAEVPFLNDSSPEPPNQPARIYDYKSEELCDEHLQVFKSCIHAVRDTTPEGFAAIKITALGNPLLLERMSTAVVEAKKLFSKFDKNNDGVLSRQDFSKSYRLFFNDADDKLPRLLDRLDPNGTDSIDYIDWSKLLTPCDLPRIVTNCRNAGPLFQASPTAEEVDLMTAMQARVNSLAEEAFACKTRLLIDAEQTRYQPAIDNLVLDLQQTFNATSLTDSPTIFNTYQAYLKDMPDRVIVDVRRSERYNYHFGAKLVRGAYMVGERKLAAEMGYPSPIHDTIEDTHKSYDTALEYLIRYRARNDVNLEVMVASHNQESITKAIKMMDGLGINPNDNFVHFAQLYGMSDNLTYTLGKNNYRAYKYLPYGKVNEVIPYLVRRGQENSDVLGNSGQEMNLIREELKRRFMFG